MSSHPSIHAIQSIQELQSIWGDNPKTEEFQYMKSMQSRSRNPFGEKIREQISSHSSIHAIQAVQELQFSWVDNPVTD